MGTHTDQWQIELKTPHNAWTKPSFPLNLNLILKKNVPRGQVVRLVRNVQETEL